MAITFLDEEVEPVKTGGLTFLDEDASEAPQALTDLPELAYPEFSPSGVEQKFSSASPDSGILSSVQGQLTGSLTRQGAAMLLRGAANNQSLEQRTAGLNDDIGQVEVGIRNIEQSIASKGYADAQDEQILASARSSFDRLVSQRDSMDKQARFSPQAEQQSALRREQGLKQGVGLLDIADQSMATAGADARSSNIGAQVGRGIGEFLAVFPAMLTGPLGLPAATAQMAASTYAGKYQEVLAETGDSEAADEAASAETVKVAPMLGAYIVGGKLAASLTAKLLPATAGAVTRGAVGTAGATAANVGVGSAIRALEGEDWRPSVENLTMDTLFGIFHGLGEYRTASVKAKQRAGEEIARREKQDPSTSDTGIVPTSDGPVAVVEGVPTRVSTNSPEVKAAESLLGPTPEDSNRPFEELMGPEIGESKTVSRLPVRENALSAEEAAAVEAASALTPEQAKTPVEPAKIEPAAEAPGGEFPTGIRNAITDADRVRLNLPPATKAERVSDQQLLDEAQSVVAKDPDAGAKLVDSLNQEPRELSDVENALLLHRKVQVMRGFEEARSEMESAKTPEEQALAAEKVSRYVDEQLKVLDAARAASAPQGRALRSRALLVADDFSPVTMLAKKRAENGGQPLPKEVEAKVMEQAKAIEQADKTIAALQAENETLKAKQVFEQASRQVKKEAKKAAKEGTGIVEFLESMEKKAKARIIARRGKLFARFDLGAVGLVDEAIIGAAHIARGVRDFTQWSAKMISDFGPRIKEYLPDLFKESQRQFDQQAKTFSKPRANPEDQLKAAAEQNTPLDGKILDAMVLQKIREGVDGFENTIKAVTTDVKKYYPDATESDVRRAFSEYGKATYPSREADLVKKREYRVLSRLTSQLEDARRKLTPLKSGPQRDKQSAVVRELATQVRDEMRKQGIETASPEQQLASTNQARATALRNQIEDLDTQLQTGVKPERQPPAPDSPEVETLRSERNAMRDLLDELEAQANPKKPPEQRKLEAQKKAVQKQIEELDRRLQGGDKKEPAAKVSDAELERLRSERKVMRDLLNEVEKPDTRTPEEKQLDRDIAIINRSRKELERRLRENDYAPRTVRDKGTDPRLIDAQFKKQKAQEDYYTGLIEDRLKNRDWKQRWIFGSKEGSGYIGETLNTSRALLTSADLSAVLRQGGFIAIGNPVRAAKSITPMLKSFASEKAANAVKSEIESRDNFKSGLYQRAKLYLAEQGGAKARAEEAFRSRWAEKIPLFGRVVKGSQRAYTAFLNKLRADTFDAMVNTLTKGGKPTLEEAKAIANFINVATGRGDFGRFAQSVETLNTTFFAPRYVLSRFQLLTGQPVARGASMRVRAQIAKEYAKFLTGAGVVMSLGLLAGATVDTDKTSPDFMKLKFGNTRLDMFSGLQQSTVLLARLASQREKNKRTGSTEVLSSFLRSKLAPVPGAALDIRDIVTGNKPPSGHPQTITEALKRSVTPIAFSDILKTMQEQGVPRGTALSLLSILGAGVNTYEEKQTQNKRKPY